MKTKFLVLTLLMTGLSACGGSPYQEVPADTSQPNTQAPTGPGGEDPYGTPWLPPCVYTDTCGDGGDGGTGGGDGGLPPADYSFRLNEENSQSWSTILPATDSILKVKIQAGRAGTLTDPKYSAFSFPYDCISYEVTVRQANQSVGRTVATQMLNAGNSSSAICGDAPTSQIIDFSDRLTGGTEDLIVEVKYPQYSFRCQMWDDLETKYYYGQGPHPAYIMGGGVVGRDYFCDLVPVYRTHTVTGSLKVQVNGTSGL